MGGGKVLEKGFFYGYDGLVWSVISIQALGGLLVAVVIKYADNILKGFACSVSIIVSAICAHFMFEFKITMAFSFGTGLVILATYLYNLPSKKQIIKETILQSKLPTDVNISKMKKNKVKALTMFKFTL